MLNFAKMFAERKRVFATSWLLSSILSCTLVGFSVVQMSHIGAPRPQNTAQPQGPLDHGPEAAPSPGHGPNVAGTLGIVAFVFLISCGVLWFLTAKIIPSSPPNQAGAPGANFSAKFKAFGGSVTVGAAGAMGGFFAICTIAVAMILILNRFLS